MRCKKYNCTAEQTCPYDAQASIFKCCTSAVYPVSREHVMALNMSVRLCAGQEGDADSGASLPPPPPHPALHVTSDHINAAVTHFQQPLPTWQSSSPSFCFFIFRDTRLDTQSFSRPELLVTCVLLVLGGGRGRGRVF